MIPFGAALSHARRIARVSRIHLPSGSRMENFDYLAPRSLDEAYAHLGNGRTSLLLAGGTDVIIQLREGRRRCDQLSDVKHSPELTAPRFTGDGTLELGAATPLALLYEDGEVRRR